MTIPTEVLDRIREEANRAADAYCDANGISMMSVGWSAYRDAVVSCKVAEWERERWIPVEERLPEDDSQVLVIMRPGMFSLATWEESLYWLIPGIGTENPDYPVTHWKPLPSPPNTK